MISPASGCDQPGDQRDQRRLAAAGEADDGDELALLDVEVDVVQHLGPPVAGAVALADALE